MEAALRKNAESSPYNELYGGAPPENSLFFRLEVYNKVGTSREEVYKRVRKTAVSVFKNDQEITLSRY